MILGVTLPSKTSKKIVCVTKKKKSFKISVSGKSGSTHVPCAFVCFLSMYVCGWACSCVHVKARGGKQGCLLQSLSTLLSETLIWLDWLASKVQRWACLCLPGAVITDVCSCTCCVCGCWGLNSNPHDHVASILSIKLSPSSSSCL